MKKFISFFVLMLSVTFASAQDVIVKKDGSTIMSKVTEIGNSEIKYKKFSNLNGPTYSLSISEILAINYENGEKETFEIQPNATPKVTKPVEEVQLPSSTYNDRVAERINAGNVLQQQRLLSSAKNWRTVGRVLWGGEMLAGLILGIAFYDVDEDNWLTCVAFTAGGAVAGGISDWICCAIAKNKENAAYSVKTAHIIQQDFNIGNNRLTVGIDMMNDHFSKERGLGLGLSYTF